MTTQETQADDITSLAVQLTQDSLTTWTDEKKTAFANTFAARVRVARYILLATARSVAAMATEKHYVSVKHLELIKVAYQYMPQDLYDKGSNQYQYPMIGGRPGKELDGIATTRAQEIINKLPGLNDAVRILNPEISAKIERKTKLLARGKVLFEEANELAQDLDLEDLDQSMSIMDFRTLVKDRQKQHLVLIQKLDEIGKEGTRLGDQVNKFLYNGLPGLSQAVVDLISEYVDQATALSALNRRVGEQVQFGDSEAALELLKGFEKDEVTVAVEVQAKFDKALEVLKLTAQKASAKAPKKLASGKA